MTITMPRGVDRARPIGAQRPSAEAHAAKPKSAAPGAAGTRAGGGKAELGSTELRLMLERFARRRVRGEDVDDLVQTVLCDALAAPVVPESASELRRWLIGIARHKIADLHRRRGRERLGPLPEPAEPAPPIEERALVGWAERQAPRTPDAQQTLDWLAREGEGEKLATIADDERLPAAQIRQRVSRLRRLLRERWVAELAAVAAVALLVLGIWRLTRTDERGPEAIRPEPIETLTPPERPPVERARALRAEATAECNREQWPRCIELLDEAARLDPAGDELPAVEQLRQRAAAAMRGPTTPKTADPLDGPQESWTSKGPTPPAPVETSTPPVQAPKQPTPQTPAPTSTVTSTRPPPTTFDSDEPFKPGPKQSKESFLDNTPPVAPQQPAPPATSTGNASAPAPSATTTVTRPLKSSRKGNDSGKGDQSF
jgi:DNA-directed RNA polymerase specialized sigma24 family protein